MKVKYYPNLRRLKVFNSLLSVAESEYLIKNAGAAIRFGCKPTHETLLGAVYLATTENQQPTNIWD